jgi:hypothetical protein
MLAFVLPSFIARQFTGIPVLSPIERYNGKMEDMQQRTRSICNYMMLSIAERARTSDLPRSQETQMSSKIVSEQEVAMRNEEPRLADACTVCRERYE